MTYSKSFGSIFLTFDCVYFDVVILHTDTSCRSVMVYHSRVAFPVSFISCSFSSG